MAIQYLMNYIPLNLKLISKFHRLLKLALYSMSPAVCYMSNITYIRSYTPYNIDNNSINM